MDTFPASVRAAATDRTATVGIYRREALRLALLLSLPILPTGAAMAQGATRVPRVGFMGWSSADAAVRYIEPFRQGLRELNYFEGKNIEIEYHWADASAQRAALIARDLVARLVDVIVVWATPAAHAAKEATQTIPIVMLVADPLATGLVSNLARPGGNITGFGSVSTELSGKRLELLTELLPGLRQVAFLGSTQDPNAPTFVRATTAAALGFAIPPSILARADEVIE